MEVLLKELQELWTPKVIERELPEEVKPRKIRKIIAFVGVRRAGKTYLFFQLINNLAKTHSRESIFYINFEDERIERRKEALTSLIPALIKLYGDGNKKYSLFLDEIQVMPDWSTWLRRVYDTYRNIDFFISGSNAKLSSKEIPTELRGRALDYEIFPLDFKEFLKMRGLELEENFEHTERKLSLIKKNLDEYLEYGGFPEVVLEDSLLLKRRIIQNYFKTIINLDIGERYRVKKPDLLADFLKILLNSTYCSINKSVNILKSQGKPAGKETIINYAHYAQEVYFCFFVPIFSYKIKDREQYPKKVFFADNGLINFVGGRLSKNFGRLYESSVFLRLRRTQAKDPSTDIYYWKNLQQEEVDFVIKEGLKIKQLIQVCYDMGDYDAKKREIKALLKASKELKCNNLLVITEEKEGEEKIGNKKIKYIPLWKWLLGR